MQTILNQTNGHQQHVSIQPGDSYHDSVLCPLPHLTSSAASCKHLVKKKKKKEYKKSQLQTDSQYLTTSSASQSFLPVRVGSNTIPVWGLMNCWSNLTFWRESSILWTSCVFSWKKEEESMLCVKRIKREKTFRIMWDEFFSWLNQPQPCFLFHLLWQWFGFIVCC